MQISKYVLANDRDMQWGLTVSTVGYEEIAPGDPYPTRGHADGYYFHVEEGRELNEYQLLYITEGKGVFTSTHQQETELNEGDMFLLFPGEWHTYHPDPETGWKSYWIGFKGKNIDERVGLRFLLREKPIYHIGFSSVIVQLYESAYATATAEEAYSQQLLAGIVNHLIGMMYSLERNIELNKNHAHVDMVNRARLRIREALESSLTIQQVAEELGVSYSNFRKLFKEYTGLSPAAYQQDLKLQRAKELLKTTNLSIKEIAYRLNFDSPDYFSAKFKIKTGRKPSEMRMRR
ncbi:AraC family transcriptional regulator [Xylanibacter rodentium]|jgi:AraC-like DNA-binding protein|uniref:AraC family transcriptional regulator n=1 Tax=Xylanibacter rodentium TaxID=2736289 RepID=A0ABX2ASI0_9BACT|nr:helix-turn-helix domain-containing protein [Xylanibacter rodentium]NPE11460.1 AraC family transcriptional regulator [Prevotella sp. PJ1A]NPE13444.1 AraC family transcriptional regulator [Xylanibacter rodentium]NPE38777.1 AraC family transcriptional regulator [Prevotella sp. PCJ2]